MTSKPLPRAESVNLYAFVDHAQVTLTGPGGTGKTRLALRVENALPYDFQDGVFFCDLAAPIVSPCAQVDIHIIA